jgi:hypothetical protein
MFLDNWLLARKVEYVGYMDSTMVESINVIDTTIVLSMWPTDSTILASSQLTKDIHWHYYCTPHVTNIFYLPK